MTDVTVVSRPDVDRLLDLEARRHELLRAAMATELAERVIPRELADEVARQVDEVGAPLEGAFVGPPWTELLEAAR